MTTLGNSEAAYLAREIAWDRFAGQPVVPPGSFEEEAALERIAQDRIEEQAQLGDTFAQRRLRQKRHYRRSI